MKILKKKNLQEYPMILAGVGYGLSSLSRFHEYILKLAGLLLELSYISCSTFHLIKSTKRLFYKLLQIVLIVRKNS